MDVKPGYKRTEVGVIPDEWAVVTLRDSAEIRTGINKPLSEMGAGALYVTVQDLYDGTSIRTERLGRIRASPQEILARSLAVGDIVFGKSSVKREGIGYPSRFPGCAEPVVFTGFAYRARAKRGVVDSDFLFHTLRAGKSRRWLIENSQASALTNINQSIADAIPIVLPCLAEQESISAALNDTDGLIESLEQLLTKKRHLKQGAMRDLLTGKKRLPEFAIRPGYQRTAVGLIPTDWESARLGDKTTKVGSGITPTGGARVYRQEGRPLLRSQNVGWGILLLDDVAFIDDETHATFQNTELDANDVLLNITGASIGRSAVADDRVQRGNVNQHVCIIRTRQAELHPHFLNYFLLSSDGQHQIDSFQAGGNRQGLNFGQVRSFRLPLPPLPEQAAIATILSDMDAEITALEAKLTKVRALKQGMMQQLLTGAIRLPVASSPAAH